MTSSNSNQKEGKRRMSSKQEENGDDSDDSFSSRQLALSVIMLLVGVLYYYYRFSAIRNNRDAAAAKHHLMNESILKMKDSIKHALIHYSLPRVQEAQNHRLTVAVGYNSNVDLITKALPVVNRLIEVEKDSFDQDQLQKMEFTVVNESFCDTLTSVPQFIACFTHFFKGGNGVERFVLNGTMFRQIVSSASTNVSHEFNIGGNAALMAVKFAKEQWKKVYLTGGSIGTQLKQLLSEYSDKIQFVTPSTTTTTGNDSNDGGKGEEKDEIHLIMEYDKNEAFAGYLTPRANRFIVTRDISNAEFHSLDEFHRVIDRNLNEIDLIVLSGFHLLDGETDVRKRRLVLEKISNKVSETYRMCNGRRSRKHDDLIMIHLELASIGQQVIYNEIGKYIFPFVHSLGLNEQELSSLYEALTRRVPVNDDLLPTGAGVGVDVGGIQQSAVSPPPPLEKLRSIAQVIPNIAQVTMALNHIMNTFHSSLQRVHFHSLAYHLLVVRNVDSTKNNNKSNNKKRDAANLAAVSSSSLAACTQACGFQSHQDIGADKVDVLFQWHEHESLIQKYSHLFSNVQLIGDIIGDDGDDTVEQPQANSLVQWTSQNGAYTFYLAPVLVCKQTIKTVGLGDAISTAGLSAQLKVERHHFDNRRSK